MTWPNVAVVLGLLVLVGFAFEGALASIERSSGYFALAAILALVVLHTREVRALIKFVLRLRGR